MKTIHIERENDFVWWVFDQPHSGANVFNEPTLQELANCLDDIEQDTTVKGLGIISAKKSIFIAGADIEAFQTLNEEEDIRSLGKAGQDVFRRIELLPFPTVAAIHGAALGGGCEMALACDYRIASSDRATKIGLPEIQLGILPAWGGCWRLPRLIGLPLALDMILAGKTWPAKLAKKKGLVDLVCPKEHIRRMATHYLKKGKRKRHGLWKSNNPLVARIAQKKASATLAAKTRGHYPAPPRALSVILQGLNTSCDDAMRLERDALVDLVQSPESRNLVRLFFMREQAKKRRIDADTEPQPIRTVGVIGAGVMGAGIAQWCAARGSRVLLKDLDHDAINAGLRRIYTLFQKAKRKHILSQQEAQQAMDRVSPVLEPVALKRADMIIEAATEKLELKKIIFHEMDQQSRDETILATNTSALSINTIADAVGDPSRVIGIHYFNPVPQMPLVEIVRGPRTSSTTLATAMNFIQKQGKFPIVVQDSPGFLVNRILLPYLIEAGHLFEQGAPLERIDQCMLDFGMPMGPLRLIDEIGVDVAHHVAAFFAETFSDRIALPEILATLLEQKELGRKSGKGFYTYNGKKEAPNLLVQKRVKGKKASDYCATEIQDRLVFLMVNEAARCLEEGIIEGPDVVDFGMIMGTGFAPFRGGPCRHADTIGLGTIAQALERWGSATYAPATYLKEHQTFYPSERNAS